MAEPRVEADQAVRVEQVQSTERDKILWQQCGGEMVDNDIRGACFAY